MFADTSTKMALGANPLSVRKDGTTLLHMCASHQTLDCVEELLKAGVPIDAQNHAGHTSLGLTIPLNNTKLGLALIAMGANPDFAKSAIGEYAIQGAFLEALKVPASHAWAAAGFSDRVIAKIHSGISPDAVGAHGLILLETAIEWQRHETVWAIRAWKSKQTIRSVILAAPAATADSPASTAPAPQLRP